MMPYHQDRQISMYINETMVKKLRGLHEFCQLIFTSDNEFSFVRNCDAAVVRSGNKCLVLSRDSSANVSSVSRN